MISKHTIDNFDKSYRNFKFISRRNTICYYSFNVFVGEEILLKFDKIDLSCLLLKSCYRTFTFISTLSSNYCHSLNLFIKGGICFENSIKIDLSKGTWPDRKYFVQCRNEQTCLWILLDLNNLPINAVLCIDRPSVIRWISALIHKSIYVVISEKNISLTFWESER